MSESTLLPQLTVEQFAALLECTNRIFLKPTKEEQESKTDNSTSSDWVRINFNNDPRIGILPPSTKVIMNEKVYSTPFSPNGNDSICWDKFYIGKKCIIRTRMASIHYGEIIYKNGEEIIVDGCRCLSYWKAPKEICIGAVAMHGLHPDSRLSPVTNNHKLCAIEIIPCTLEAIESIESYSAF